MDASTFVETSAQLATRMVASECRGPGDIENAMRRLEARYGIPYAVLWSLRYRKPKTILVDIYARIVNAYDHECERQRQLLAHEREIFKAKNWAAAALARAASHVVGEGD